MRQQKEVIPNDCPSPPPDQNLRTLNTHTTLVLHVRGSPSLSVGEYFSLNKKGVSSQTSSWVFLEMRVSLLRSFSSAELSRRIQDCYRGRRAGLDSQTCLGQVVCQVVRKS